jgi:hypothetical protein
MWRLKLSLTYDSKTPFHLPFFIILSSEKMTPYSRSGRVYGIQTG